MASPSTPRTRAGFTLVEVLVVLVIGSFVLGAVYEIMISQSQAFGRQSEISDVQNTLRSAAVMLSTELRAIDPEDLYGMDSTSLHLRSYTGSGIICGKHPTQLRFGLIDVSGGFTANAGDSALVLAIGESGTSDDEWRVFVTDHVGTGVSVGVPKCSWGDDAEVGVQVSGATAADTIGVAVGGGILGFQPVEYGLQQEDGRWWLARRVGGATTWDLLTGPLLSPSEGGLEVTYLDSIGNTPASVTDVAAVRLVLRAKSFGQTRSKAGLSHVRDTLAMRIAMRKSS